MGAEGFYTGGFRDWHVHLELMRPEPSPVTRVLDLGSNVERLRGIADGLRGVTVSYAGAFITAPGGYPSDRSWAGPGSVIEVDGAAAAREAALSMREVGASVLKVAMNSIAGPAASSDVVRAVVAAAAGLPVVAHAEGPGEAQRARECGATMLAHTPFTERLDDAEIAAQAEHVVWISTLDIHGWGTPDDEFGIAVDNLRRFHRAGGVVRYGTDMGNGPTVAGFNTREMAALAECGLSRAEILATLTPAAPAQGGPVVFVPGTPERPDVAAAVLVDTAAH